MSVLNRATGNFLSVACAFFLAFGLGANAFAQSAGGTAPPAPPVGAISSASADYLVGPGDLLTISVYRAPDLQTNTRVATNGTIVFAALGEIKVENMTTRQISEHIAQILKDRGILLQPSVNVLVADIRSKMVSVMGSIARPGQIPLDRPNMMLSEVLAQAGATFGTGAGIVTAMGGTGGSAAREQFRISELVSGARDRPARAGETLVVQSAPSVYVSGEVGRPGAFPLETNMTVGQAIALGGGITPRGSSSRIELQRKDANGNVTKVDRVSMNSQVAPDDLIIVKRRIF